MHRSAALLGVDATALLSIVGAWLAANPIVTIGGILGIFWYCCCIYDFIHRKLHPTVCNICGSRKDS